MALWVGFNSHVVSLTRRHRPHSPCLHMVAHVGCEDRVPNARTRRALSGLQMLNDRSDTCGWGRLRGLRTGRGWRGGGLSRWLGAKGYAVAKGWARGEGYGVLSGATRGRVARLVDRQRLLETCTPARRAERRIAHSTTRPNDIECHDADCCYVMAPHSRTRG